MIIIKTNYHFTEQDKGKTVLLANNQQATIISVIREYGGLCIVCGCNEDKSDILLWDHQGRSEDPDLNIRAIIE